MMRHRFWVTALLVATVSAAAGAQAPVAIDTSRIGPQVGTTVPDFEGVDQFGKPRTLRSALGPKGAMVVFFRSSDW